MDIAKVIEALDNEIGKLTAARNALAQIDGTGTTKKSTGRRTMSPEARARISRAMRLRWAARKKKSA